MDLRIDRLAASYATGTSPVEVAEWVTAAADASDPAVWIARDPAHLRARAEALAALAPDARGPLHGVPFAVKDNIDVAGYETTAACPAAAYRPDQSAAAVARLEAAGAMVVGKTNLDQFATGLVGVRSPYGAPRSVFREEMISGGSSSGSAVAVGAHLVSFALGTDTAGSGRVPAAFNGIVGLKPTRGAIPCSGVVPANRSLDCVSVFAGTTADAVRVLDVAAGIDAGDPFSRTGTAKALPAKPRLGVPAAPEFFGDAQAEAAFAGALEAVRQDFEIVPFDFAPLAQTAALLYGSAWVAERTHATRHVAREAMHPVTREIVAGGDGYSAVDAYDALYRAAAARREAEALWAAFDAILVPTTPTIYSVAAVEADPITLNSRLGTYTNFVNLMDLAAIAVPAGFRADGLPHGVTLIAPAWTDAALAHLGGRLHASLCPEYGRDRTPLAAADAAPDGGGGFVDIAVVGAHLAGMPLNHQLTDRGGVLIETTRTAPGYRLFALAGTVPPKPGLLRDPSVTAGGIELEVWRLSTEAFGAFVEEVPAPLGIGTVTLADGRTVKGFIAEPYGLDGAEDITAMGGWRAYRARQPG